MIAMLGWAGFQLQGGGGVDTTPQRRAQLIGPSNPMQTDPGAPEVTWTRNSAKNDYGIFGNSASRRFRKFIICHVFGEKD